MPFNAAFTRPGGTISGPAMMALVDFGMYAAIMGAIGEVALAVTTSLNINFLRRPAPVGMAAASATLTIRRRLAVNEVTLYSVGQADPLAHAPGPNSTPPPPQRPD